RTDVYMPMMPPYLPAHRELVLLSGVAEVVLGLAVLVPQTRRVAAWGIILLLIAIFPANLHIAMHDVPLFGATQGAGVWNWGRLPSEGVLVAGAWWCMPTQDCVLGRGGRASVNRGVARATAVPRPAELARQTRQPR